MHEVHLFHVSVYTCNNIELFVNQITPNSMWYAHWNYQIGIQIV